MTALLTDNLPLMAGAPNGIKKLRELILELAVRGKLVPQDPNDEPASELLKRIAEEKKRLAAEGKIKKNKQEEYEVTEVHYSIPENWDVASLGQVVEIVRGITFPASEKSRTPEPGRVACLRTANVQDEIEWDDLLYIRESFVSREDQYIQPHDIVMSMANSRELVGKVAIIDVELTQKTSFGGFLGVLRPVFIEPRFVMALLRTPHARSALIDSSSQTTNIANVSLAKLKPLPFAIPPLPEQHRIVAKVDELMALCDRLEAEQAEAKNAHTQLVQALLDSLTQASDATDFATNWQRLAEHFHILFTTESSIDALKQTLLQLAVMGKLVPQDPNDEPASELLRRIAEERESCVAGRRSAKHTTLPSTDDTEKTFELPSGWEWVRLQQIISVSSGDGLVSANMKVEGGIPVYGGNGVTGYHDKKNIDKATLVIGRVGYYCGSIHLTPASAWITDNALIVSFSEENLYKNFLFWLLKGTNLKEQENATAQPVISGRKIYPIVLAIPPLAEQHRIVAKVDQLMALCDQLKTSLTQARQLNEQLASTMIEQAVA